MIVQKLTIIPTNKAHITDDRSGSAYIIPIHHNAIQASALAKIQGLHTEAGYDSLVSNALRIVDEALEHIATQISRIMGDYTEVGIKSPEHALVSPSPNL